MSAAAEAVSEALNELDRAKRVLSRTSTAKIRSSEHRQLLKALALSWFRAHKAAVSTEVPLEAIARIDRAYQRLLDGAERETARAVFLGAIQDARSGLIAARGAALARPIKHERSSEAAPSFAGVSADRAMQTILAQRWEECTRCLRARAPLAATVMMGGLLEALLVARANQLADKALLFRARAAPLDGKTKKPLDLRFWTLAPYIDVAHELGWISRSAKDVAVVVRDYRNYVHPEKQRSHNLTLTQEDAEMFWEVVKQLSRQLLGITEPEEKRAGA